MNRNLLLTCTMVLASVANVAIGDKKVYPATFCDPNYRGEITCLTYSRYGFVVNNCEKDIDVVCPLVRDKVDSDERFIEVTVSYESDEDIDCSFKSNRVKMHDYIPHPEYDACDFVLPAHANYEMVRRNHPHRERCASNQMPDSATGLDVYDWNGYALTCRLPHESKLGHYFADEPDQ